MTSVGRRTSAIARANTTIIVITAQTARGMYRVMIPPCFLERGIQREVSPPSLAAVPEIEGNCARWCRPDDETHSITRMETVQCKISRLGCHLRFIDEEGPIQCSPDPVPIFSSQT